MNKSKLILISLLLGLGLLIGCNSTSNGETEAVTEVESKETDIVKEEASEEIIEDVTSDEEKSISICATGGGISEDIIRTAIPVLEEKGYEVDLELFNDFNTPNTAVAEGSYDCNLYQHEPFLIEFNKSNGTDLVVADDTGVYVMKHGLFSDYYDSIEELPENAKVGIYNDTSNRKLSLEMLEDVGLIKLKEEVEFPTVQDIVGNPKNIEIVEMEGMTLIGAVQDLDLITSSANSWAKSGRDPEDALYLIDDESGKEILVTRPELKGTQKMIDMQEAINSEEVREMLETDYKGIIDITF